MPIWDDEQDLPASQPQSVTQRVRACNALPILSNAALFDMALFGCESFRSYYAEKIGYPFPQIPGPAQLANYDRYTNRASDVECKALYLDCFKNHIYREARTAGVDADILAEGCGKQGANWLPDSKLAWRGFCIAMHLEESP